MAKCSHLGYHVIILYHSADYAFTIDKRTKKLDRHVLCIFIRSKWQYFGFTPYEMLPLRNSMGTKYDRLISHMIPRAKYRGLHLTN